MEYKGESNKIYLFWQWWAVIIICWSWLLFQL